MSETPVTNPAPGFARDPGHSIAVAPAGRRMRVIVAGCVIAADSGDVLVMREADYAPVYYFPRDDVATDLLRRSDRTTTCPFKGDATYWTVTAGDRSEENVAWSYDAPYDEMQAIAGRIAFYQDRVKLEVL